MSALVILVHADRRVRRHIEALLFREGCLVAALGSFEESKSLLDSVMPDLLIGDVPPASHARVKRAVRNYHYNPQVPVIITSTAHDPLVEMEAKRYGTPYVVAPLENPECLVAVHAAIAERRLAQRPVRRWLRRKVAPVVELDVADTRAKILDISYGGLRLAFADARSIPQTFEITLPTDQSTITVHRVWTADSPHDGFICCGAVLMEAEADSWRAFVNAVEDPAAR
jgi:DNA-binding response OmpR family regulator